jgi:hypothetical protein
MNKKLILPPLLRLTPQEAHSVVNIFRVYDYKSTGKIPNYLASKVMKALGFDVNPSSFNSEVSIQEVLLYLDQLIPEPEPALLSSLMSFKQLASIPDEELGSVITPQAISDFMESIGRPPASLSEASLMLNGMLDYDDCSEIPTVSTEVFNRELINYAKKYNAFKDYRP